MKIKRGGNTHDKIKKFVTIALSAVMTTVALTGCSSSSDDSTAKEDGKGSVYYLNFKPESGRTMEKDS